MLRPPVEHRPRLRNSAAALRTSIAVVLVILLASACGGSSTDTATDNSNIIDAGQIGQIQLPDDDPPAPPPPPAAASDTDSSATDTEGAEPEATEGEDDADAEATDDADATEDDAEAKAEEEDEDAIPLAEDDQPAIFSLIDAFDDFSSCMDREGFEFIGVPGQDGPPEDFPAGYGQALGACAASSNIVQAIQDSAAENAELTPEEIEQRNEAYFRFEDCLKGKGWDPAEPVPDEYGVLGPAGGNFGQPDSVDDPIGPIRECAAEAAAPLLEQAENS